MKYIFIDTSLFIDVATGKDSSTILDFILNKLNQKNSRFKMIFPEVILTEIVTQYNYFRDVVILKIKENLKVEKILEIEEVVSDGKQPKKKTKEGEYEIETLNNIINPHRKNIVSEVEKHYDEINKKINNIIYHKNAQVIKIDNQTIIAGIRRSLLKKSPYTRLEKATENSHTKDIDCIALEMIRTFCEDNYKKEKNQQLIICVIDKDYYSKDGELHDDIKNDIRIPIKCYNSIFDMLKKEFSFVGKNNNKSRVNNNPIGSLSGGREPLIKGS